jgi:hypothetical protein
MLSIVESMDDPGLFQPWFRGPTWNGWRTVLKAAYALPMNDVERAFFRTVAERDPPKKRVREAWLVAGRRSGKDSVASLVTAYSASMFDRKQSELRRGEKALCSCLASDRDQSKIVLNYVRSYFDDLPLLRNMLGRNTATGFDLSNSVDVSITTNSFRAVRGRPILTAILDECAFWRDERSANPDEETYRAITPGMATLRDSMLIGISSPYRKAGLLYRKFKEHYARDTDDVLVIRAPTKVLNPTIDQAVIDRAMEDDPLAAKAEWLAEWRDDITGFVSFELIEAAVDRGVTVRPPVPGTRYVSFVDPSGGMHDSFTAAVAHMDGTTAVLDCLIEVRAPCNPVVATEQIAPVLKTYGLHSTTGDRFGSGFSVATFAVGARPLLALSGSDAAVYVGTRAPARQSPARLPVRRIGAPQLPDRQADHRPRPRRPRRPVQRRRWRAGAGRVEEGPDEDQRCAVGARRPARSLSKLHAIRRRPMVASIIGGLLGKPPTSR